MRVVKGEMLVVVVDRWGARYGTIRSVLPPVGVPRRDRYERRASDRDRGYMEGSAALRDRRTAHLACVAGGVSHVRWDVKAKEELGQCGPSAEKCCVRGRSQTAA